MDRRCNQQGYFLEKFGRVDTATQPRTGFGEPLSAPEKGPLGVRDGPGHGSAVITVEVDNASWPLLACPGTRVGSAVGQRARGINS